jgi:adenosine deaminase
MVSRAEVERMAKVELHVHLEGSIRPETVLKLARHNGIALPASTVEGLREWYTFRNFPHFVEVYIAVSRCIQSADDLETVVREFFEGQKEQDILYTEATFTASTIARFNGIPWPDQLGALGRGLEFARRELGIEGRFILDIVRGDTPEGAAEVLRWALEGREAGAVCALGLAGEESRGTGQYAEVFATARAEGLPIAAHAGETVGPSSIREVLDLGADRIGHGVRCLEDPSLTDELRRRQIPLEVCPTSNVRLGVYPSWETHPLPLLLQEGLYVTLNSDDPPMFGTSLNQEFTTAAELFGWGLETVRGLIDNAARAAFLPEREKAELRARLHA